LASVTKRQNNENTTIDDTRKIKRTAGAFSTPKWSREFANAVNATAPSGSDVVSVTREIPGRLCALN
jgi:hypothetical protein